MEDQVIGGEGGFRPDVILLDIEGTTTPIAFVHDRLFPYAFDRLEEFLIHQSGEPEVLAAIEQLRLEHAREAPGGRERPPFGDGLAYARSLIKADRKSPGLKSIQGLLWKEGYRKGDLEGEVFADVPEALDLWRQAGIRLRIYSSGSVLAQRLLFGSTSYGDLTPFFEAFHDTAIGGKLEAESYLEIAGSAGLPPEHMLFVSDSVGELKAAEAAGMRAVLSVRPGNPPTEEAGFTVIRSLLEVAIG